MRRRPRVQRIRNAQAVIRVLFLISALNRGGAERQLTLLVRALDRARFAITVVTVYDGGALRGAIEGIEGVEVLSLHKQGRGDYLKPLLRLWRILRQKHPHIVHGCMGSANELALLFGKRIGAKAVWGIRASNIDFSHYDRISAWHFHLSARLSRFADLIIANSFAGRDHHLASGYAGERMIVIPNGFETDRFRPDRHAGNRIREAWRIPPDALLIGLVARIDPMKDHTTFLRAAALLAAKRDDVRFVCVGDGREPYRQSLTALGDELGLGARLVWAGELANMPSVQNALDIATSAANFGEGFSNAIGEAMACGVPCVVTDVGDSALLVGDTGIVVPPGDPAALAAAWSALLDLSPHRQGELGAAARERMIRHYSVEALARSTERAMVRLVH